MSPSLAILRRQPTSETARTGGRGEQRAGGERQRSGECDDGRIRRRGLAAAHPGGAGPGTGRPRAGRRRGRRRLRRRAAFAADVAIADGVIAGVGDYPMRAETDRRRRQDRRPVVHRRPRPHSRARSSGSPSSPARSFRAAPARSSPIPHEIANVAGLPGIAALRDGGRRTAAARPLHRSLLRPGQRQRESRRRLRRRRDRRGRSPGRRRVGLGELMNFPGVLAGDAEIAAKLGRRRSAGGATATRPVCADAPCRRTPGPVPAPTTNRPRSTRRGRSCGPG